MSVCKGKNCTTQHRSRGCWGNHNKMEARRRAENNSESEAECAVYRAYCSDHGFVHGAEAEELRAGIEKILRSGEEYVSADDLRLLINRVDARDSLAFLEAQDD